MKKFTIIISFCFIFTLNAMEQHPHEFSIGFAQEKHIPALKALSEEVTDEFFKPTMIREYSDYPPESLHTFFNELDRAVEELFRKATSNLDNSDDHIVIASHNEDPDKILGLCAFTKKENLLFVQYLIVSQQLRGKGIGKALLNKVLSIYEDLTVCGLVTLARGNAAAHAFYEHLGFTSTKELCAALECMPNTHIMYQLDIKK